MNSLFSRGVMTATMRRNKIIGIVVLAFIVLAIADFAIRPFIYSTDESMKEVVVATLSDIAVSSVQRICFISAFIMTVAAFPQLRKKDTSDFFHALPHKRETVFVSSIAAVVAVNTVIILIGTALQVLFSFVHSMGTDAVLSLLINAVYSIVGAYLIAAVVALSMSVTGTVFSGSTISLIILFMPRVLFLMFNYAVTTSLPSTLYPSADVAGGITDYNIVSSLLLPSLSKDGALPILYTALLAISYTVIGVVLYCRRKSEMAGMSAPSRRLQAVFRIVVGYSLFAIITAVAAVASFYDILTPNIGFFIIVAYIFAAILYFLYELITTKSWKNVARAIPGLVIVVLLSAVSFGGIVYKYNDELYFGTEAGDIDSICFEYYGDNKSLTKLWEKDIENYTVTDEKVIELARKGLEQNIEYSKENPNSLHLSGWTYTVTFKVGLRTEKRIIYFASDDEQDRNDFFKEYDKTVELITQNKNFEIDPDKCDFAYQSYLSVGTPIFEDYLGEKEEKQLLEGVADEINSLSTLEWGERENRLRKLQGPTISLNEYAFLGITYNYDDNSHVVIPLCRETLPKSYDLHNELLVQSVASKDVNFEKLWEEKGSVPYMMLEFVVDSDGKFLYDSYWNYDSETAEFCRNVQYEHVVYRRIKYGDVVGVFSYVDEDRRCYIALPLENVSKEDFVLANKGENS